MGTLTYKRYKRRIKILVLLIILCSFWLYYEYSQTDYRFDVSRGYKLFSAVTDTYDIDYISENSCYCDFATVSNIINSMKVDGFSVETETSNDGILSYVISNAEDSYNLIYQEAEQKLLVVGYDYQKSYIPMTYINER